MKKSFLSLALLGLAALPLPAAAQAPAEAAPAALPNVDPAMWVVKDEDTTVYLFGTFHMLDGKRDWFNDEVKTAFDGSQELVLEAIIPEDPAALQPLVIKYAVDPQGRGLSTKLSPEAKAKVDAALTSLGVPAGALEPLEPWFVSMTLASAGAQKMGLTGEHGPETILTKAAKAAGKPVSELEGAEKQLAMFDALPEEHQVKLLNESVEQFSKLEETFASMIAAWSDGDIDALNALMTEGIGDDKVLYDMMFTKRNAAWADWIAARMEKPGTVFMAVGAGHLAGDDSVQAKLKAKGIESARVGK
ncbi:MAG: TraB/GumN family protein [Allosphingosinicella sp.]